MDLCYKSNRHQGIAQHLLDSLRKVLKYKHIETLVGLTASKEEAQRFYKSIPNSKMSDIGI